MHDFIPIFAIFSVFGSITAIVFGPQVLKYREKRDMQETIRHAVDKGQQLPPELIDVLTKDVQKSLPSRTKDIRRGVIWLASGIGIAAFSVVSELGGGFNGNLDSGLLGISCIPVTIGLAFIVLSFFNKGAD
ncbi:DUF6249 domain-containing protein [Brevundimonas vesicularis]|uniref:DUF6249 domain-containing protein n=1 Tax=Brevundimonas vesicularis TaxID=41276 RepID=UPI0022ABD221|nr:DUF6249 domain-containing protein [Brevundimonas vesicularis]